MLPLTDLFFFGEERLVGQRVLAVERLVRVVVVGRLVHTVGQTASIKLERQIQCVEQFMHLKFVGWSLFTCQ